jgi:hypothetical protein
VLNKLFKNKYGGELYPDENEYNEYNSMSFDLYEIIFFSALAYGVTRFIFYLFG